MNGFVIAAVLCAACMHAGWNVLLKRQAGQAAGGVPTMAIVAGSGLLCAGGLPFLDAPAPASWPFIAASALAQTLYYRLLAATYRDGDMSHAYPLMRGCAPPSWPWPAWPWANTCAPDNGWPWAWSAAAC